MTARSASRLLAVSAAARIATAVQPGEKLPMPCPRPYVWPTLIACAYLIAAAAATPLETVSRRLLATGDQPSSLPTFYSAEVEHVHLKLQSQHMLKADLGTQDKQLPTGPLQQHAPRGSHQQMGTLQLKSPLDPFLHIGNRSQRDQVPGQSS